MTSARRRRGLGRRGEVRAAWLLLLPALVALLLLRVVPLVSAGIDSLFAPVRGSLDTQFGLDNFTYLLTTSTTFLPSLGTTLALVLFTVAVQTVCSLAIAVLLSRRVFASGVLRTLIILPVAVPIAASTVIWGIAFRPDGPLNALLAVVGIPPQPFLTSSGQAPYVIVVILSWIGVGYWMLFLVSGINDIPGHLYEAAELDGAGGMRRFFSITLPLLRRPLVFVIVANTVANYLVFAPSQILTQGGPSGSTRVVMYDIFIQAFTNGDRHLAAAEIVLSMAVLLVLVGIQFRVLGREDS